VYVQHTRTDYMAMERACGEQQHDTAARTTPNNPLPPMHTWLAATHTTRTEGGPPFTHHAAPGAPATPSSEVRPVSQPSRCEPCNPLVQALPRPGSLPMRCSERFSARARRQAQAAVAQSRLRTWSALSLRTDRAPSTASSWDGDEPSSTHVDGDGGQLSLDVKGDAAYAAGYASGMSFAAPHVKRTPRAPL
jgi:hypothetical protein